MIQHHGKLDPIAWIEDFCTQSRGGDAGEQLVLRDWQREFLDRLLNTRREDGRRRYRECGVWLPRKNGKTMLIACLTAYFWMNEVGKNGQIVLTATTAKQAGILFHDVFTILNDRMPDKFKNPMKRYNCRHHMKEIDDTQTGAKLFVLSSDGAAHGWDPKLIICDEIHSWRNFGLWDALQTSQGSQAEPMFITITTAGVWDTESIEYTAYQYACKVRDGMIDDPAYLPMIHEAPHDAEWDEPEVWKACNPALGDFLQMDYLERQASKAKAQPAFLNEFKRLHLNMHTAQRTAWIDTAQWKAAVRGKVEFSSTPVGGLDLSTKLDVTAFCLTGRNERGGLSTKSLMFIPRETALAHMKTDKVPYDRWEEMGHVEFTPGHRVDQKYITQRVLELCREHNCWEINIDPWNAESMIQDLEAEGITVYEHPQSHVRNTSEACKELDALLADGTFEIEHNECMNWMAGNVELGPPNRDGHRRPQKPKQGAKRVDGITALVISINGCIKSDDAYESYEKGSCIL